MSISSSITFRSEADSDYAVDARGSFEKINKSNRRPQYRRSGTAPGSVNGIHRRRSSRWTWGHGRGARMQNARAFAGCIAAALVAACACTASAGTIKLGSGVGAPTMEFVNVGNPGNAGNPLAPTNVNYTPYNGAVSYSFDIGKYEVTNNQYAAFLNSVQASGSNTYSLYNSSMGSSSQGGINFVAGNAPGSKYVVKSSYGSLPVNFVSWMDAARMANWLQNDQSPTGTESGAYIFTSGSTGVRQPDAKFFIPNANEWYKAAFYSPVVSATNPLISGTGGYWTYSTQSQTLQALSAPNATSNAANVASVNGGVVSVDAYSNASSYYGAFGMAGNVAEWTDTTNTSNTTRLNLGGWQSGAALIASSTSASSITQSVSTLNSENANIGFRIAAVPEPSTIVLLGCGAAGLAFQTLRRRKASAPTMAEVVAV